MNESIEIFVVSSIGNSRSNQEDNYLIPSRGVESLGGININANGDDNVMYNYTIAPKRFIALVSDGMGGHSYGEVASYMTAQFFSDYQLKIASDNHKEIIEDLAKLNRMVYMKANETSSRKGMGATLCGFVYQEDKILGFNVGDSRLYRFDNGVLQQLSKDHTEGRRLLDLKLLNEEELKSFPNRKAIYKYIGMKTDLVADVFEIAPCEQGTILLLCTDGLTDVLNDPEIQEILNSNMTLREKGEKLLNTALERNVGHGDNITIILTEF